MSSGSGGSLSWVQDFGTANALGQARVNELIACDRTSGQFEVGGAVDDGGTIKAFLMSVSETDGSIQWSHFFSEGSGMSLTSFDCESSVKIAASFVVYNAGDAKLMRGSQAYVATFSYSSASAALTESKYISEGTNFCSFAQVQHDTSAGYIYAIYYSDGGAYAYNMMLFIFGSTSLSVI